jgi:uridine kinase
MKPFVIGVAGGSGSGKTTVVRHIIERVGPLNLTLIQHDSYYRDMQELPFDERVKQNFDHPASLETDLMVSHLKSLLQGQHVDIPVYDFAAHVRAEYVLKATPRPVILVDGILIFFEKELRDLMDMRIFVDTDADVRLLRRLKRDLIERGRSIDSVLDQYESFVRPMHLEFVEPTKRYADIIIPNGGENVAALDMLDALITRKVSG